MGKRANVKDRKERKVWAEAEDSGDDDNIISLRRGRDTTKIDPPDEFATPEVKESPGSGSSQKKKEKEPPKVVRPKTTTPKSRKTPMEWSIRSSDEESDESDDLPLSRLKTMASSKGCGETIKNL